MEIGYRFVKLSCVKIGKLSLETSECLARIANDIQIVTAVLGNGIHIVHNTPALAVAHENIVAAVLGMMDMQTHTVLVLFSDMAGNSVNIFHYLSGVLKHININYLKHITLDIAVRLHIIDLKGLVYITVCYRSI